MFLRLWIFRLWQNQVSDKRTLRIEAWLGRTEIGEAFDQQSRARQKE